jgi:hypothetical protein
MPDVLPKMLATSRNPTMPDIMTETRPRFTNLFA